MKIKNISKKLIHIDITGVGALLTSVILDRREGIQGDIFCACHSGATIGSDRIHGIFRKSVAQGLGKGAFCSDVLEFVAFFLLGTSRVGIGDADIPEGIFGKHYAERRAHGGLKRLAGFKNFNVELFAHGKGTVLHHAVEDDARDLCRVCCCRAGNGLRGTCRPLAKG